MGQNPKPKICCYQTQVSLALWGYTSAKMRGILLDLREKAEPEERVEADHEVPCGRKGEATATR